MLNKKMIDLNTHILHFDNNDDDFTISIKMLEDKITNGVSKVVLTPRFCRTVSEPSCEMVYSKFNLFCEAVKERNLNIELYLGEQLFISGESGYSKCLKMLREKKLLTYGDTNFVLFEFRKKHKCDTDEIIYSCVHDGFIPIIAHIEKYPYLKLSKIETLYRLGAKPSVDASSICGKNGLKVKFKAYKLIKHNLVSFVSSGVNYKEKNYMLKAYKKIKLRFGRKIADKLFETNPAKIIEDIKNHAQRA